MQNKAILGEEEVLPDFQPIVLSQMIPRFLKIPIGNILQKLGEYRQSLVIKHIGNKKVKDFHLNTFKKIKMHKNLDKYLKDNNIDAIISPAFPTPAFKHNEFKNINLGFIHCALWNFYDYPTVLIPRVHIVQPDETNPDDYVDNGCASFSGDPASKSLPS